MTTEPLPEKKTKQKKRKGPRYPPEAIQAAFDEFWKYYPRKVGKRAARLAFERAVARLAPERPNLEVLGWLAARAADFAASPAGQRGCYTPHPTTWLNQGRYDDPDDQWAEVAERDPRGTVAAMEEFLAGRTEATESDAG